MYFQYRLYSIIVTFINKIFLIRLWLIHGISDQQFCFEATNLHSLKHIVILSPARFPSCHGVTEQLEEAGQVPAARGSSGIGSHRSPWVLVPSALMVQRMGGTQSLCLPLPAAAKWVQPNHFLPSFLRFLICETQMAIQPPFWEVLWSLWPKHFTPELIFSSSPVHWKLLPSIAGEAEENMYLAFYCSSLLQFLKHCPGTGKVHKCILS